MTQLNMSSDLRRLRLPGLIEPLPGTHPHRVTDFRLRSSLVLHERTPTDGRSKPRAVSMRLAPGWGSQDSARHLSLEWPTRPTSMPGCPEKQTGQRLDSPTSTLTGQAL